MSSIVADGDDHSFAICDDDDDSVHVSNEDNQDQSSLGDDSAESDQSSVAPDNTFCKELFDNRSATNTGSQAPWIPISMAR